MSWLICFAAQASSALLTLQESNSSNTAKKPSPVKVPTQKGLQSQKDKKIGRFTYIISFPKSVVC